METRSVGRPSKDLTPLREALSALGRSGFGLVRVPIDRLSTRLGWNPRTVTSGLERLEDLGEVRLKQRGRGKRGILVQFLDVDGKPTRVPLWRQPTIPSC
jgi:hypothetical protein